MSKRRRASPCPALAAGSLLAAFLAACASTPAPPTSGLPLSSPRSGVSLASPSPTPMPTPRFTNSADAELSALIPARLGSVAIQKPAVGTFAVTPGDIGQAAFGEIGLRFSGLALAFVASPPLSLYAMRVDPPAVRTGELQPQLAAIGEYVGVAGLHPEAWKGAVVAERQVWTRGEDSATRVGTRIYTWAAGKYVFLLIGTDDRLNRAMIAALPGEAPPSPTPRPTSSAASAAPSASASGAPATSPAS